ncbi:MAG: hypothetical protein SFU53_07920 [Terrimicrobiaceae bacterium]|nr:hypothetical protein [Terrimicrobiaceae bacterium]
MTPVCEFDRLARDVVIWHSYQAAVRAGCGSTAVRVQTGWVVFDPLPLEEVAWAALLGIAPVTAIVLTSGNHERASSDFARRSGSLVHAPAGARGEVRADVFHEADAIVHGFRSISLPGAGPGETAWTDGSTLVIGDALINLDGLALLPDKYCSDPKLLRRSLRVLLSETFERVTFAHGEPLVEQANDRLSEFVSCL